MTEHKDPEPSPESQDFTADLVEAVRGPLLVLDSSLRVQTANPSFYRTFALSPAEVENHLLAELQGGQWKVPALQALLEDALARKSFGQDFRLEHTFPAYGPRTMLVNVRYFPAQDNRPEFLLLSLEDLTEREQKAQLEETQKKALQAERLAAVGQVITGLAHESRNALQRSQSCLEMLSLVVQDRPQALDLLDRLQKAQDHLQRLYEDASQYAAPITLRLLPHPVAELWRSAWARLERQRQGRQAMLREEVASDTICPGDPFRLEQVFCNILDNALAACADPVEIVIACSEIDAVQKSNGAAAGGRYLRVSIRDNGPGLGADPEKIFEPFYTTKVRGTGLGLAIVKRIVEAHGGWVKAETSGPGAAIVITLPRGEP